MSPSFVKRAALATYVAGWILLAFGLAMLAKEMLTPGALAEGRRWYLLIDSCAVMLGAQFIDAEKTGKLIARVGTYLPVLGGRRAADRDEAERVSIAANKLPSDQHAQATVEQITGPAKMPPPPPPKRAD